MKAFMKNIAAAALVLAAAMAAQAQPARYLEGVHYFQVGSGEPAADTPQVLELFWYGCGHCYAFEPLLQSWMAGKGGEVALARTPAQWSAATENHARLYYTLEALDLAETLHRPVIDAIHREGRALLRDAERKTFLAAQGVDTAAFAKAWDSFGVDTRLRRAAQQQRDWGLTGVPALLVNGRYRVDYGTSAVPTQQDMLKVADYLLKQAH